MGIRKSTKIIPWPMINGAYLVLSFMPEDCGNKNSHTISFLYDGGNGIAAEWEPTYGPITTIYKCEGKDPDAIPHWFFDYCTGYGNWSQCAVEDEGLPQAVINGDYEHVFSVLKRRTIRRNYD